MSIMEIKGVRYSYDNKRNVLKGVSAELDAGKMYAILGPSGCGKTTLLSLLGGLDSPLEGQILFEGQDIETIGLMLVIRKSFLMKIAILTENAMILEVQVTL